MLRSLPAMAALLLFVVCSSCNNNKAKPVSNDIAKTAVTVNGKKDSVINNPKKKYGNATVAEPCVKCLIKVIQHTVEYNAAMASKPAGVTNFVVNWTEATQPQNTESAHQATNGLKIDIVEKENADHKVASFVYDNSLSKLFFAENNKNIEVKIDKSNLKKIRDKCYWGVASSK